MLLFPLPAGPVGTLIESHLEFKRERLQRTIQRRKDLGPVPDSEVVIEEHPDLKVSYAVLHALGRHKLMVMLSTRVSATIMNCYFLV